MQLNSILLKTGSCSTVLGPRDKRPNRASPTFEIPDWLNSNFLAKYCFHLVLGFQVQGQAEDRGIDFKLYYTLKRASCGRDSKENELSQPNQA